MTFNRIRLAVAALLAAILATLHLPAIAQENVDAHAELYDAIQSGMDQDVMIENTIDSIRREYAKVPDFIALEASSPGFIDDYVDALKPVFLKSMERANTEMKGDMIALFAREFTPDEALEVAGHYRSPPMQRLLRNVSTNFAPDNTLSEIESGDPITSSQINRDISSAAIRGTFALSPEDRKDIERRMKESEPLRRFENLTPKIIAIRTEQENKPLTAAEEAELTAIAQKFFADRFGD